MRYSLAIFINRKLISIDYILPLLCEIKNIYPKLKIKVICPDFSTKQAINKNLFIKDQIHKLGKLYVLSIRNSKNKRSFFKIINTLMLLSSIFVDCVISRISFIHFGLLFNKPFKCLNILNEKKSFFCENDPYGFTQLMQDVTFLKKDSPMKVPNIKAGSLIAFSKIWHLTECYDKNKYYYFGTSKKRKFWIDLVLSESDSYIKKALNEKNFDENSTLVSVMLGYFGELKYLSSKDSVLNSLEDTIKILSKYVDKEVVVFKPHVFTDLVILDKILKKFNNFNYIITNLHPMVLATRSKFAIANYYSTTLSDFNSLGIKTIEYTDYCSKALSLTGGGSLRPDKIDFFINKDSLKLSYTIKELLESSVRIKYDYNNLNVDELFSALNGKKL